MEYMLLITERADHFTDFTKEQWDVPDRGLRRPATGRTRALTTDAPDH